MSTVTGTQTVARKSKNPSSPKRYGSLIRVTDEFAEAIRDASSLEKMSIAEFAQTYLTRTVRDHYKKTIKRLAKKVDETDERGSRP
jgi:hypothetical protein